MIVQCNDELLTDIADAIRETADTDTTYYPSEMSEAIQKLFVLMTQEEYDALAEYDSDVIYLIKGVPPT